MARGRARTATCSGSSRPTSASTSSCSRARGSRTRRRCGGCIAPRIRAYFFRYGRRSDLDADRARARRAARGAAVGRPEDADARRRAAHRRPRACGRRRLSALMPELLRVENLRTSFRTEAGVVRAVDGVDFELDAGPDARRRRRVGQRQVGDGALDHAPRRAPGRDPGGEPDPLRRARPRRALASASSRRSAATTISMIFQEPMTSLNPVYTVGDQIAESVRLHRRRGREGGARRARSRCSSWSGSPRRRGGRTTTRTSSPAACASA